MYRTNDRNAKDKTKNMQNDYSYENIIEAYMCHIVYLYKLSMHYRKKAKRHKAYDTITCLCLKNERKVS